MHTKAVQADEVRQTPRQQRTDLVDRMSAAVASSQSVREAIVKAMVENCDDDDDDNDNDGGGTFNFPIETHLRRALDQNNATQYNLVRVADWLNVYNYPLGRFKVTLSILHSDDDDEKES